MSSPPLPPVPASRSEVAPDSVRGALRREGAPGVKEASGRGVAAKIALRTAVTYAVMGGLWILLSDRLLVLLIPDLDLVARIGMAKGFAFVAFTALLLYGVLRSQLRRWEDVVLARQKTEAALRRSERTLARAQELAQIGSWDFDSERRAFVASPTAARLFGLEPGAARMRQIMDAVHPDDRAWVKTIWIAASKGAPFDIQHRVVVQGETRWLRTKGQFEPGAAPGDRVGAVGFSQDITARKIGEDAVRDRLRLEAQLSHLTATVPGVLYMMQTWPDGRSRFLYAGAALESLTGIKPERILGDATPLLERIHPEDFGRYQEAVADALARMGEFRVELRMNAGERGWLWLDLRSSPEPRRDGSVVWHGFATDVSRRKQAELTLRASEERFREVVETIREVFWITDAQQSALLYLSPRFHDIWGAPNANLKEALGQWIASIHPEDREQVLNVARPRIATGSYDETYRILRPSGEVRWIRDQAFPVRDADGAVRRIIGVAEDVTEKKFLEQQFLRAQRLEGIGTLASGIAHDINNILAPMMFVPRLLRSSLEKAADRELLDMVEKGAQRGAGIVRQLLTFSRGIEGQRGPVQVAHLLKEMHAIMRETFPRDIEIVVSAPPEIWTVHADGTQLHQVLMNLCVNARDAMPEGGTLRIGVEHLVLGEEAPRLEPAARPGPYVVLVISDTGQGMTPEVRERIFDPFFTTKGVGKGTGLGLSTTLGIVKSHGGFLTVDSVPGRGSVFRVHLPAQLESADDCDTLTGTAAPRGKGETLLVVDDEESLRQALQLVLQTDGYEVIVAADGREALRLFHEHRNQVRLVLTDLMMPGMSGQALIRQLRELEPVLPIVATTGLNENVSVESLAQYAVLDVIPKPFDARRLLDAIALRLAAGGS